MRNGELRDSPVSEILSAESDWCQVAKDDLPSRIGRKIRVARALMRKVRVNSWEHLHSSFI
jgi:hypothetical protein